MIKLRDRFWLWGQGAGSHHYHKDESQPNGNIYNLPGENRMGPAAGGEFFGIPNCCRVAMSDGPVPPFDAESAKLTDFKQLVWSAVGSGGIARNSNDLSDIDEVIRQAAMFPNITGAVLDDFFASVEGFDTGGAIARHSVKSIAAIKDKLHNFSQRKLDLWLVWYTYQLEYEVAEYIDLCDVITLWFWRESELNQLDELITDFIAKTPGKRRLAGCYMWDYGGKKPLTNEQMQHQLDAYYSWIKKGELEGVVLCSNAIADIGLEAVDLTKKWLEQHGDEEL
jgi:hypothetical protein